MQKCWVYMSTYHNGYVAHSCSMAAICLVRYQINVELHGSKHLVHMHAHRYTSIDVYVHSYMHSHTDSCLATYIPTCIHSYMHACTHICIHTNIHTCIIPIYLHAYSIHVCNMSIFSILLEIKISGNSGNIVISTFLISNNLLLLSV